VDDDVIHHIEVDCDCLGDFSHRMVVELVDPGKDWDPEIYVFLSNGESSLLRRLQVAWRIILYGTGSFSDIYIKPDNFFEFYGKLTWLANDLRTLVTRRLKDEEEKATKRR